MRSVVVDGIGIITLTQQKTDTEVSIPILNDNLIRIFEKYDYNIPHINNSILNNRIKVILLSMYEERPSDFSRMIAYPEYADRILEALHVLLNKKKGKDVALIMLCALDEGLITSAAHKDIFIIPPSYLHIAHSGYIKAHYLE